MDSSPYILIVEDDTTIAMGLVAALEHDRFDVRHVISGEDALASVRARQPDLILCDIMLPGIDGLDVMKQVKTDYPSLPIIMLTANTQAEHVAACREAGANRHLGKPFTSAGLFGEIQAVMGH